MGPKCYAVQCIVIGEENLNCPFPWDFMTLLEEDSAMAIGNMHRKSGKDCMCGSGNMFLDRHTDTNTDTHVLIAILCHCSHGP